MLERLDSYILCKLEVFFHWTQRMFGVTTMAWLVLFKVLQIGSAVYDGIHEKRMGVGLGFYAVAMWFTLDTVVSVSIKRNRQGQTGTANRRRYESFYIVTRPILGFLAVIDYIIPPRVHYFTPQTISEYVMAIDDLPHDKSKVRKWLESFKLEALPDLQGVGA